VSIDMVGVDVGGTFTDLVGIEDGRIVVVKVPTDVDASEASVLAGAEQLGVESASVFNLASTAGINAIITRRIPKVAFLATLGHRDMLDRARLGRPLEALTDMTWRRGISDTARPLVPRYLRRGIRERVTATGDVLIPLDEDQAREELVVLAKCDIEAIAICLMNAYVDGRHERRLRELVREVLGADVVCSISSEVSPLAKEYVRASSTVVDVLMKQKYSDYTERLVGGLRKLGFDGELSYADCSARLLPADYAMERPYRLVVGGPAAGTVSAAHLGRFIDDGRLLCADVGGTSCDISVVIDGEPWVNTTFELEHDLVVNALSTDIVTLGAGGGSVVWMSPTGEVRVGPDSAGAQPGPACYGQGGGRPTLTDAALLMGVLDPGRFLDGRMPLQPALAEKAFLELDTDLSLEQRVDYAWRMGLNNVAEGILNIAIRRGIDVRDFSLVAFGAAGPMILPGLLDLLPLRRVIVPPHPGPFSALGLVSSDLVYSDDRSAYSILSPESAPEIEQLFRSLEQGLLQRAGAEAGDVTFVRTFDGRLAGQSWETPFVTVPDGPLTAESIGAVIEAFHKAYALRNGNTFPAFPVQGVTFRVQLVVPTAKVAYESIPTRGQDPLLPTSTVTLRHVAGGSLPAAEYERTQLLHGDVITGPAVVREPMSTTYLPAGRTLTVGVLGELNIE
jgi:N-methylhydantoinase A